MVQAATLILAAFAVAPVFSAPLSQTTAEESFTRSVDIDSEALELRDPFKFGGFLKKAANVAKKVGKVALPAARLLLRDTEGNLYEVRAFDDTDDLSTRDVDELDAREPRFKLGRVVRRIGGVAGKVGGIAGQVAGFAGGLGLRELEDDIELNARNILEAEELLERELSDLDTRDPKFRLGRFLKKAGGVAGRVAGVAASLALRDELDGLDLDARAYQELEELLEREFADLDELEARDPKFRLGRLVRKIGGVAGKVGGVAGRVAGIAGSLGLRDLEGMETETREVSIDELD